MKSPITSIAISLPRSLPALWMWCHSVVPRCGNVMATYSRLEVLVVRVLLVFFVVLMPFGTTLTASALRVWYSFGCQPAQRRDYGFVFRYLGTLWGLNTASRDQLPSGTTLTASAVRAWHSFGCQPAQRRHYGFVFRYLSALWGFDTASRDHFWSGWPSRGTNRPVFSIPKPGVGWGKNVVRPKIYFYSGFCPSVDLHRRPLPFFIIIWDGRG